MREGFGRLVELLKVRGGLVAVVAGTWRARGTREGSWSARGAFCTGSRMARGCAGAEGSWSGYKIQQYKTYWDLRSLLVQVSESRAATLQGWSQPFPLQPSSSCLW